MSLDRPNEDARPAPADHPASDRRAFIGGVAATLVSLTAQAQERAPPSLANPATGHEAADGFTVLEARPGLLRLAAKPAPDTAVWSYNGAVPGPLLRVRKGEEVKVRLVNKLEQPTSLCWHGVRLANPMDGVAGLTQMPVAPGGSFDYRFTPPDSGLFWYHPHVWPLSAEQLDRGLYGVLLVEEAEPPAVDQDLLVVLDDWTLDVGGQIRGDFVAEPADRQDGRIGPLMTANSVPIPLRAAAAPGSRVRLRLLSVVSARIMVVGFEGAPVRVQAIDGQPCDLFEPVRQTIPIGPGARFDLLLDLPGETGREVRLVLRGAGEPDRLLFALAATGAAREPRAAIAALPQNPALPAAIHLERALKMNLVIDGGAKAPASASFQAGDPEEGARAFPTRATRPAPKPAAGSTPATASLPAGDPRHIWTVNGVASDGFSDKPLFSVKRGAPVSLAFVNKTAFAQQIHVHGHAMRLLHDLDDGWEPYWRDAVLVAQGRTKHVAFVADNPGRWAIESLVLDRQVTGLAAWFEVT